MIISNPNLTAEEVASLQAMVIEHLELTQATVHETARAVGRSVPAIQPRFSELKRDGRIRATGERRLNSSGKSANVWMVTNGPHRNPS